MNVESRTTLEKSLMIDAFDILGGKKEEERRGRKITMGKRSKCKVFRTPQGVGGTRGDKTQRTRKEG